MKDPKDIKMAGTNKQKEVPQGKTVSYKILDLLVFAAFVSCIGGYLVSGNYHAAWFSLTTAFYYSLYMIESRANERKPETTRA